MLPAVMTGHEGLAFSRRFPGVLPAASRISAVELGALMLLGFAAASLTVLLRSSLGLPGHNVLRVIFPMATGLALVPRRGSASIMGLSGLAGAALLSAGRPHGLGAGAMTSLVLIGFLLDAALLGARSGRSVYFRLTAAGLAANLVALAVRAGAKVVAGESLAIWLPRALVSYPVWGILAGLISAAVWFRATPVHLPASNRKAAV